MQQHPNTALIDIGANLTHQSFSDDLDDVLERALQHGVGEILVTGTSVAASREALLLAEQYPGRLYSTAGVHPHEASEFSLADIDLLRQYAGHSACVALGEAGLDYHRNYSPRDAQLGAFEAQLELATELAMPVFIHERDAADDMLRLLTHFRPRLEHLVVHCFTGSERTLDAYLDLDLFIGITGWICDERRGTDLRTLVRKIPADRLMLETDAPYLMPRDYPLKSKMQSQRRNEPCTLAHIAKTVAHCRGESEDVLREQCRLNSLAFFGLSS